MNYMWEVILQGEDQGLSREDIRFRSSQISNPYREVFFRNFNEATVSEESVDVNAHYRYGAILGALLDEDMERYPELRDVLFDVLAHYLTQLDLRSGLCRDEYYARFLRADIQNGLLGAKNAERLNYFSRKQKSIVTYGLLRAHKAGVSMILFAQLLRELYPQSIVYLDARGVRELLVYVGKKQTPELTAQLELLCDILVPMDYDVKLFWNTHFGLIGTEETMEIGGIMMY
ncbi:hypothetical protein FACS1894171_0900 [Clostridia bacterium]|nr:hypothetical protein FACS1894171_0900 [Clostridia bacterium]